MLTTQHLDEADQLADRICVIDAGRVIAEGTPDQLKSRLGGDRIDVVVRRDEQLAAAAEIVGSVAGTEPEIDRDDRRASAPVADRMAALTELLRRFDDAGIEAEDVAVRRPTLDEVFMALTGRPSHSDAEIEKEVAA